MSRWERSWEATQNTDEKPDALLMATGDVVLTPLSEVKMKGVTLSVLSFFRKGHGGGNPNCRATYTRGWAAGRGSA